MRYLPVKPGKKAPPPRPDNPYTRFYTRQPSPRDLRLRAGQPPRKK